MARGYGYSSILDDLSTVPVPVGTTGVVVSAGIVYYGMKTAMMVSMVLDGSDVATRFVHRVFTCYVFTYSPSI